MWWIDAYHWFARVCFMHMNAHTYPCLHFSLHVCQPVCLFVCQCAIVCLHVFRIHVRMYVRSMLLTFKILVYGGSSTDSQCQRLKAKSFSTFKCMLRFVVASLLNEKNIGSKTHGGCTHNALATSAACAALAATVASSHLGLHTATLGQAQAGVIEETLATWVLNW